MEETELALLHNTFVLETERLDLVVPRPEHAPELFELVGGVDRAEITANLLWDGPDSVDELHEWIERCTALPYGEHGLHWVLVDREGAVSRQPGTVLGSAGTRPVGPAGRADVGYWLGKAFWGQGVMTEAVTAIVDLGARTLGYMKVEASVFTTNASSARVLEKIGFEREGLIRRYYLKQGEWVDAWLYGLVAG